MGVLQHREPPERDLEEVAEILHRHSIHADGEWPQVEVERAAGARANAEVAHASEFCWTGARWPHALSPGEMKMKMKVVFISDCGLLPSSPAVKASGPGTSTGLVQ